MGRKHTMTVAQAGALGGKALVKKRGKKYMRTIASAGGKIGGKVKPGRGVTGVTKKQIDNWEVPPPGYGGWEWEEEKEEEDTDEN